MGKRGPKPRLFVELYEVGPDCWTWAGALFSNGYGRFGDTTAHRHMYEISHGPVPAGMVVMHSCDNPACVRPSHLSVGTPADNMTDMVTKGRSLRGARNPQVKLTTSEVLAIRNRHALGASKASLAREFGVSEALIFAVVKRTAWSWVA